VYFEFFQLLQIVFYLLIFNITYEQSISCFMILSSCLFGKVQLFTWSHTSLGVAELILLRKLRIDEFVLFEHDVSDDSHVGLSFRLFVLDWLPMGVPEILVWSEYRVLLVSNNTQWWHASRNVESSMKSSVERLWFNTPNIIIFQGVWLN
jgi:hypothetical protein